MPNVLFYNKKGGQGKTTLATNYAKHIKGKFITNDENNYTEEIFGIDTQMISANQSIESVEVDDEKSNIFDFGGYTDDRVLTVAEFCDVCIVPVFYQGEVDLKVALETMATMRNQNENSIFVINNTKKEYIDDLKYFLEEKARTFVIPHSLFLAQNNKSIYETFEESSSLHKHIITKHVMPKIEDLFKYLTNGVSNG